MRTKEFIERVEELGYHCFKNESYIFVSKKGYPLIATIALHKMYSITLYTDDNKLGELCMKYARTPIDERGEEQKFYLQKIKSFYQEGLYNEKYAYLNFNKRNGSFWLSSTAYDDDNKTQFTQKEIDKIKQEQHTDLSEFKQISVEEVGE